MKRVAIDLTDSDVARFWRYIRRDDAGCWGWTGATRSGYGVLNVRGTVLYAHRISYKIAHGEIPPGLRVLHHCDNPPCARPDHLYAGTQLDNIHDAIRRGRWRGNERPRTVDPTLRFARYRERQRAKRASLPRIPCACGCGHEIPSVTSEGKPARYALGHNGGGEQTQFRKGQSPWNLGVPMRESSKAKMVAAKFGKKLHT